MSFYWAMYISINHVVPHVKWCTIPLSCPVYNDNLPSSRDFFHVNKCKHGRCWWIRRSLCLLPKNALDMPCVVSSGSWCKPKYGTLFKLKLQNSVVILVNVMNGSGDVKFPWNYSSFI